MKQDHKLLPYILAIMVKNFKINKDETKITNKKTHKIERSFL